MKQHVLFGFLAGVLVLCVCLCVDNCIDGRFSLAFVNAASSGLCAAGLSINVRRNHDRT